MSQMRTHRMEGREREVCIRELGNMACHRWLTRWRGGRGRSAFMSSEKHGTSQMRTHRLDIWVLDNWCRRRRAIFGGLGESVPQGLHETSRGNQEMKDILFTKQVAKPK